MAIANPAGAGLRFDVNCSILFTELPLLERPAAAKAAGFDAVEFWWPFDRAVPSDREVDAFVRTIDDAGVALVGLNFAAGNMPAGDRGLLSDPSHTAEFTDGVDIAVDIARRTGCRALNALYGNRVEGCSPAEQDELAVENLTLAARAAEPAGAVVLLEALNAKENPRYPLRTAADVARVIDVLPAGNVRFLADFYHLAISGEAAAEVVAAHHELIGHVQIADVPGRNQPGTGGFDFDELFGALGAHGYSGWVGLEYRPTGASIDSFDWLNDGP